LFVGVSPARSAVVGARPRVLVVDDNVDAADALALLLDQAGFAVVVAHDGGEALERALDVQPDIVLLDLGLPVLDGYKVARVLRARPGGETPLLVAISGYGRREDRRRSQQAGIDHHLVKPVDCAQLIALMRARPHNPAADLSVLRTIV
jgi:CheY-like chemotaxis protein